MRTNERREFLSIAEVAAELGVSAVTIRRKIAAGELPAVQLGGSGSSVRVPRDALEGWLWSAPDGTETADADR
jgi:excisionase family DNA binding protein